MKQKFQIGDRVRATNNTGAQDWIHGEEFTIIEYHKEKGGMGHDYGLRSSGWYESDDTSEANGYWEANLELVEPNLEESLAAAKAKVAELEQQIAERDRVDLDALPNGSVIKTPYYYWVKAPKGWRAIADDSGLDVTISAGPFQSSEFGTYNVKVIREGF